MPRQRQGRAFAVRRVCTGTVAALCCLAAACLVPLAGAAADPAGGRASFSPEGVRWARDHIIVKLKPWAVAAAMAGGDGEMQASAAGAAGLPGLALVQPLLARGGAAGGGGAARRRGLAAASQGAAAAAVYKILDGSSVAAKVAQMRALSQVAWASPDMRLYPAVLPPGSAAAAEDAAAARADVAARGAAAAGGRRGATRRLAQGGGGAVVPNDPRFPDQWHHPTIDSSHAWALARGAGPARLCIIDSGMQRGHPDLPQPAEGWNAVWRQYPGEWAERMPRQGDPDFNDWEDRQYHGTHVAGIAAALGNGVGVAGLAYQARRRPPPPPPVLAGAGCGTSMATPLVAAAAAMLFNAADAALQRAVGYAEVKQALLGSVDPFVGAASLVSSGGQLNAARALRLLLYGQTAAPPPSPPSPPGTGTLVPSPGERWLHWVDSAAYFEALPTTNYTLCTQTCILDVRCGKYVFFRPPASTTRNYVTVHCLLWSATAVQSEVILNPNVDAERGGAITATALAAAAPPPAVT
ncbi:hypothetical protein CHLNCDRAFT_137580 [Chlorella variabilis]|uniref:Peptidase S8/S53 domain-containing protein n=1 Tax=Chlorella variabilis TaxID=554065 RepID=E1Z409_CHLVA|nr:hypothetical protein CHLNCDRAFT_137580 [Chlorella variabilis]EFN59270.1 hypothetical protein CHLNCDRAFT_137580 [Chlorella variabilis]|eukprot:XP_005851372.1 hypothetical protein CHLNCDRAFT_137580 [Chlorella variabilis]